MLQCLVKNSLHQTLVWHIYLLRWLAVSGTRLVEWHNRRIYGTWDCKGTITDSNHQTCIRVVRPTPLHTPGMPTSACNCMTIVPVPEMTGTNTRIWQCTKVQNSNKDFWTASWPFHSKALVYKHSWLCHFWPSNQYYYDKIIHYQFESYWQQCNHEMIWS